MVTMYEELLEGAYDLHVHTGPDVNQRKLDDFDYAERIQKLGMKGFGIKSHYFCSAERARLVKKFYPNLNPLGAICLNHSVGGINPSAVEMAGRDGAKIVWMPTFDAANELEFMFNNTSYDRLPPWAKVQLELKEQGKVTKGITIFDADGHVSAPVHEVLDIIAHHKMLLATGHLGKSEIFAVVKEARIHNVKKILITHPTFSSVGLSKEEQKELAEMGAVMDQCFGVITPEYGMTWDVFYEQLRYVGPEHCILSSDLGQTDNPYPDEGMVTFVSNLRENGFTDKEVRRMTAENTTLLVEG